MLHQNLKITFMKQIFKNSYGCNTAVISCKNNKTKFNLYYHLSDNPVQHTWQDIHCANKKLKIGVHHRIDIIELTARLKFYCNKVSVKFEEPVTQQYLNWLHHEFVLNAETEEWQIINFLIHRIEDTSREFSTFDSTLNFYCDPEVYYPMKEEYKLFLNNNCVWGQLLLGYGTLGKDWSDISRDDHFEDLIIQEAISSETVMHFTAEQPFHLFQEQKFYSWAKSSNLDVPLDNLNELSLGRYHLGQIIITDVFLKFHPNPSDWYVPNHSCKLRWNQQFFTADTIVEEITFENTDLFYNTLISHNNFDTLNV